MVMDKKTIAKWCSYIALAIPGLVSLYYSELARIDNGNTLLGITAICLFVLISSVLYVKKSGNTRLIPELVYIGSIVLIIRLINNVFDFSLIILLFYLLYAVGIACRVYLFIANTREYRSDEARAERMRLNRQYESDRRIRTAEKNYEAARADYESKLKYSKNFRDIEIAKSKLEDAERECIRVHKEENR